ncbi:MAG: hypothetical protein J6S44_00960 [Clostridia bacterium]|nr:hypothetical protein [Clostridia bacterium]MBO5755494.1 hypothetical protein [Clostridia bacterium]MBO7171061.1 hypothetical protein [Clostridia bacterium]
MKKIDAVVIKETKYIGLWTLVLSLLMQAVFLVIGRWDYTVLLGNLLSGAAAILNFLLMGITVQRALGKEEAEAKTFIKMSQLYRFLFLIVVVVIGVVLPCFHSLSAVIPMFFPRVAIAIRPLFDKKRS